MGNWFHTNAAKSKRDDEGDQPTSAPMRPLSAVRRNPSTDQKKVRRQMSKKASGNFYLTSVDTGTKFDAVFADWSGNPGLVPEDGFFPVKTMVTGEWFYARPTGRTTHKWGMDAPTVELWNVENTVIDNAAWGVRGSRVPGIWVTNPDAFSRTGSVTAASDNVFVSEDGVTVGWENPDYDPNAGNATHDEGWDDMTEFSEDWAHTAAKYRYDDDVEFMDFAENAPHGFYVINDGAVEGPLDKGDSRIWSAYWWNGTSLTQPTPTVMPHSASAHSGIDLRSALTRRAAEVAAVRQVAAEVGDVVYELRDGDYYVEVTLNSTQYRGDSQRYVVTQLTVDRSGGISSENEVAAVQTLGEARRIADATMSAKKAADNKQQAELDRFDSIYSRTASRRTAGVSFVPTATDSGAESYTVVDSDGFTLGYVTYNGNGWSVTTDNGITLLTTVDSYLDAAKVLNDQRAWVNGRSASRRTAFYERDEYDDYDREMTDSYDNDEAEDGYEAGKDDARDNKPFMLSWSDRDGFSHPFYGDVSKNWAGAFFDGWETGGGSHAQTVPLRKHLAGRKTAMTSTAWVRQADGSLRLTGARGEYALVTSFGLQWEIRNASGSRVFGGSAENELDATTQAEYVLNRRQFGDRRQSSRKTAMPAPADLGVSVGDIFYTSWGYDQTNVNFYQVVRLTGAGVEVRPIRSRVVSGDAYNESVVAQPGAWDTDDVLIGGDSKMCRLKTGYEGRPSISLSRDHDAWLWDGSPRHQSGPYGGH